jgi:hypothetical protein
MGDTIKAITVKKKIHIIVLRAIRIISLSAKIIKHLLKQSILYEHNIRLHHVPDSAAHKNTQQQLYSL